jgi:dCMP deaminase
MMNSTWHRRYIQMAGLVASWSKDPSTKVGCILVNPESQVVVSTGFNGMPRGIEEYNVVEEAGHHGRPFMQADGLHKERWARPEKYQWVEHAERNAIYNAARFGQPTLGCIAYMNFDPSCICTSCARAMIQAGIVEIVGPDRPFPGKGEQWEDDLLLAQAMLVEAGIRYTRIEDANG